ncbi:MAG: helix-turn-helix domain-containing protein, partial [Clostridiales bacterium]|nr:helix-turn-helix domain-containing protein [Clostridiales bacterium]
PDILLTDIRMPFMDGLALSERARALYPDLPILLYTSYGEFDYAMRAIQIQVSGYILKPVSRARLIDQLSRVVEECRARGRSAREDAENALIAQMRGLARPGAARRALQSLGVAEHAPLTLYLLQSSAPIFAGRDEQFAALCARWAGEGCCHWLLNEHQAMALLADVPPREAPRRGAALRDLVAGSMPGAPTVLWARAEGVADLRGAYRRVDSLADGRLLARGGVYGAQALEAIADADRLREAQAMVEEAAAALRRGDADAAHLHASGVVAALDELGNLSSVYAKYLCVRLAQALAGQAGEGARLAHEIFAAKDVPALRGVMERTLAAIAPQQADEAGAADAIRAYVHRHYGSDLSLERVAASVHLSPAYVSFLFKRETGVSLIKYIAGHRVERACALLRDTNLKITDIAARVGYDNPSYFTAVFRAHVGQTPVQYRRGAQEGQ